MIDQKHIIAESRQMSKNNQATIEAAARFDANLKAAMEEAHEAGLDAINEFLRTSPLVKEGVIYDTAGWAFVKVWKPSYHFRESLKRLYPKERALRGAWTLNIGFGKKRPEINQSITADEVYCKAALKIMSAHFPDEEFTVESRVD